MTTWDDKNLFDVEDSTTTPKVRDLEVHPVTTRDVDGFCARYHYAKVGGNKTWRWGLWEGPILHGVVAYNLPTRTTCESVFGPEHRERVWHMGRLALSDATPNNAESRLIAGSLKRITREHPHVWAVLTYAAVEKGHIGYVYQATNALYTGTGGHSVFYVDPNGGRRSDYLGGAFVSKARAISLGWTRNAGDVKHRYVYLLGSSTHRKHLRRLLKLPVLPYPKATPSGTGTVR